jgi:hypothetical protein
VFGVGIAHALQGGDGGTGLGTVNTRPPSLCAVLRNRFADCSPSVMARGRLPRLVGTSSIKGELSS